MLEITSGGLLTFAKLLNGKTLKTLHQGKPFSIGFDGGTLVYTPESSGADRPHQAQYLEKVCTRFTETNSLRPTDYTDCTVNASYTLALIVAYLGAVVQGEVESPLRQLTKSLT